MRCSVCHWLIPDNVKYFLLFKAENGFRVEVGCGHYTPIGPGRLAIISSPECLYKYVNLWIASQRECKH